MNKFPCEVSGIALNLLPRPHLFSAWWVEDKDFAQSHTSAGRSWLGTWLPPEECVLHWKILQKWLTQGISFPAGCVMKKTSWQRCSGGGAVALSCGSWVNGFTDMWSSLHPPTPFLFTASSRAPSPRFRLGMMRRTRGRSLSTLPTWGRRSRLWMNCGGTFPLLPVPFGKNLLGERHQRLRAEVRIPLTLPHLLSLGFPFTLQAR